MIDIWEVIEQELGDQMRADDAVCIEVWCALSNIIWSHKDCGEWSETFRTAGAGIVDILGRGSYMDWYCSGQDGVVSDRVANALTKHGWTWREYSEGEDSVTIGELLDHISGFME